MKMSFARLTAILAAISVLPAGCVSQAELHAFHAQPQKLVDRYDELLIGRSLADLKKEHAERWDRYVVGGARPERSFRGGEVSTRVRFEPWIAAEFELLYPFRESRAQRAERLASMSCTLYLDVDENGVITDTDASRDDISYISGTHIAVDLKHKPSACAHAIDHELGLPKQPEAGLLFPTKG